MFSSCLAINENRVNDNRHFLCCRKTRSKEEMKKDNESRRRIFCCAGSRPNSREEVESALERYPRRFLSWFVLLRPVKVIILIGFAAYLGVSIWGAINLEQGLVATNLVSKDSYYYKYRTWNDELFSDNIPVGFYFDQPLDYSSSTTQAQIQSLINAAKADKFMSDRHISWLDSYLASTHFTAANFVNGLKAYLNDTAYSQFKHDVVVTGNDVTASRIYVFSLTVDDSQDQGQLMLNMRNVASDSGLPVIAFHPSFIFYEQYVAILPQTLQTLGIAIAAVFVITALFMPNPILLIYVVITMAMIITGVVGFMKHWDLTLSSITMIHLIMSVGFSVDFTAHICHGYMVAKGQTREDRVRIALQNTGAPIFNGAVSSILGILMLSFAKSYIFQSFFQVMFLVVLFGCAHAVLFLPVVLSLIGPGTSKSDSTCGNRSSVTDRVGRDNPVVLYNGKDIDVDRKHQL